MVFKEVTGSISNKFRGDKMKERIKHIIIKDFQYKGRRCVVIKIDRKKPNGKIPEILINSYKSYHNGYIEMRRKELKKDYDDYDIKSDSITYQGDLKFVNGLDVSDGKIYIGFDSCHIWNDNYPKSKTASYVEKTCRKIVDELKK